MDDSKPLVTVSLYEFDGELKPPIATVPIMESLADEATETFPYARDGEGRWLQSPHIRGLGLGPERRPVQEIQSINQTLEARKADEKHREVQAWLQHIGFLESPNAELSETTPSEYTDNISPREILTGDKTENRHLPGRIYYKLDDNSKEGSQVDFEFMEASRDWTDPPVVYPISSTKRQPETSAQAIEKFNHLCNEVDNNSAGSNAGSNAASRGTFWADEAEPSPIEPVASGIFLKKYMANENSQARSSPMPAPPSISLTTNPVGPRKRSRSEKGHLPVPTIHGNLAPPVRSRSRSWDNPRRGGSLNIGESRPTINTAVGNTGKGVFASPGDTISPYSALSPLSITSSNIRPGRMRSRSSLSQYSMTDQRTNSGSQIGAMDESALDRNSADDSSPRLFLTPAMSPSTNIASDQQVLIFDAELNADICESPTRAYMTPQSLALPYGSTPHSFTDDTSTSGIDAESSIHLHDEGSGAQHSRSQSTHSRWGSISMQSPSVAGAHWNTLARESIALESLAHPPSEFDLDPPPYAFIGTANISAGKKSTKDAAVQTTDNRSTEQVAGQEIKDCAAIEQIAPDASSSADSSPTIAPQTTDLSGRVRQVGLLRIRIEAVSLSSSMDGFECDEEGEDEESIDDLALAPEDHDLSENTGAENSRSDGQDDNITGTSGTASSYTNSNSLQSGYRKNGQGYEQSDENNDGNKDDRAPRTGPPEADRHTNSPRFACPYEAAQRGSSLGCLHKSRKNKFGGCQDIRRLKQHLKRKHMVSSRCGRCWRSWDTKKALDLHRAEGTRCEEQSMDSSEQFMDRALEAEVEKIGRQGLEEENWWKIFCLVIPEAQGRSLQSLKQFYYPYYIDSTTYMIPAITLPEIALQPGILGFDYDSSNGFGSQDALAPNLGQTAPLISPAISVPLFQFPNGMSQPPDSWTPFTPPQSGTVNSSITESRADSVFQTPLPSANTRQSSVAATSSEQNPMRRNYERLRERTLRAETENSGFRDANRESRIDLDRIDTIIEDVLATELPANLFESLSQVSGLLADIKARLR